MRPQNTIARQQLEIALRKNPPVLASELSKQLKVSVPTILRILNERKQTVFRIGTTKNARYALRRPLRGSVKTIPIYKVDPNGRGHHFGALELAEPQGSFMDLRAMRWPTDNDGWWDGLPYPLHDLRPQGFLGRNFARKIYQENSISSNPDDWSDDDIVYVLTRYCSDNSGNLIVGDQAYESWLRNVANPYSLLPAATLYERYTELADAVTSQIGTGSNAAGEFPKFTAERDLPNARTPHVIVKFSGTDNSTAVRRWSDLLICESLALEALRDQTQLRVAATRVFKEQNGRTFLEVERFDRHGMLGRSELISLSNLNGALIGKGTSSWPDLASELGRLQFTTPKLEAEVSLLWWYGRLIANSDMHQGNLSFHLDSAEEGGHPKLGLAPAYDMLPMLYAPLSGGEVPNRDFDPPLPLPQERDVWHAACKAAIHFWDSASNHSMIGESFRAQCAQNGAKLEVLSHKI